MPEVRAGETEDQYLKRCIPEVIDEGASPDQAVAICIAKYNQERDTYEGQFKQEHILYHKSFHNIRESFVKKYTRRTIRALKDVLTPIFDANTVDEMRGVNLNQKPLDDLFLDLYTDVGSTFAKLSYNNLKQHMALETKQAPDFVERMATFASTGHDRTRVIAINQGKEIQRLIGKALEEELGIAQAGERVKELVTQNINTYQAERIARTEILSASNFGSVEGAKSTGLPLMKQWISVLGDSTRNGHSTAHGTVVDLYDENGGDGVFEVGGEFLRFAGDPNGRPDNIINCRCTQVFLTKEEALGEQPEQEEEEVQQVVAPTSQGKLTPYNPKDAKFQSNINLDDIVFDEMSGVTLYKGGVPTDDLYALFLKWLPNAKERQQYRNWNNRNRISPDAPTKQGELADLQGFKGKPSVISDSDFQKLLDDDEYEIIYRGLADTKTMSAEDLVNQYKYDEMFDGVGVYGDGTYFAGRNSRIPPDGSDVLERTALVYAEGKNDNIIAGAFKKSDARMIHYTQVYPLIREFNKEIGVGGKIRKQLKKKYNFTTDFIKDMPEKAREELDALYDLLDENSPAEFLTMLGFDGMYIEKGFSPRGMIDVDFYVMFNRSKLIINDKNGY